MPGNFLPTGVEFFRFLPEIILTIAGTFMMVLDPLTNERGRQTVLQRDSDIDQRSHSHGIVARRSARHW